MYQLHLIEVDPQRIKFNPLNPRKHRGTEYIRLRENIKRIGIIQLPTVRVLDGKFFEAIDGEGRISIAQEEHFEKIWVISVGIIEEHEALVMLQSANTMRSFNFLAECKGLANLHRQGNTSEQLAEQFSSSQQRMITMVAIGYFPDELLAKIQDDIASSEEHAAYWGHGLLAHMLRLRELLPGQYAAGGAKWSSLDGVYDYREVTMAAEEVMSGKITTKEQMHTYVVNRKYEIYQERFNQDLNRRLEEELAQTKKELEAVNEKKIHEIEEKTQMRYQSQVEVLQSQLDDLAKRHKQIINQVAKRPEIIEKREEELQEALQKAEKERRELQDRRNQWEEEIHRAQMKALEEARQKQEQWEREFKQALGEELDAQREKQKKKLQEMEDDLKAFYAQKDQKQQIKAENTIRGLLSNGIKSLADAQQIIDHIVSPSIIQGVQQLGGAQHESLLWAIQSLSEALERAEKKLIYGDIVLHVESGGTNGYKA